MNPPTKAKNIGRVLPQLLLALAFVTLPFVLLAQAPTWWSSRGVTNGNTQNDYAAVNQGQVKNIAVQAIAELDADLPGGAGDTLLALAAQLSATTANTNDYAAVNLGQLKHLAKPFYDRLADFSYQGHPLESGTYPWIGGTANDYAMANIGQVKNLFSFKLPLAPPWVYAGPNQSVSLSGTVASVTLSGTVTDADTPLAAISTTWRMDSGTGTVTFANPSALSTTATFDTAGIYVLRLSANDGQAIRSDTVMIVVNPESLQSASVFLASPAASATYAMPASVPLSANVSGTGMRVVKIEYFDGTQKIGESSDAASAYAAAWSPPNGGMYVITALATMSNAIQIVSAPALVAVTQDGVTQPTTPGNNGSGSSNADNAKPKDSDDDCVPDDLDGLPYDPDLSPPRLPQAQYAVIDLGQLGFINPTLFNDSCHILDVVDESNRRIWSSGTCGNTFSVDTDYNAGMSGRLSNIDTFVGSSCIWSASGSNQLQPCSIPQIGSVSLGRFSVPVTGASGTTSTIVNGISRTGYVFGLEYISGSCASDLYLYSPINISGTTVDSDGGDIYSTISSYSAIIWSPPNGTPATAGSTAQSSTTCKLDVHTNEPDYHYSDLVYYNSGSATTQSTGTSIVISINDVNIDKTVVVGSRTETTGTPHAAVLTTTDNITTPLPDTSGTLGSTAMAVNSGSNPWIAGTDNGNAVFWAKVNNAWKEKNLGPYNPQTKQADQISGTAIRVNDRYEILLDNNRLWQNGQIVNLDKRVTGYTNVAPYDLNNNGAMLATATGTDASGHYLLLLPIEVTNKADPTKRNGANGKDMPISFKNSDSDTSLSTVAWIAAHDPNNNNAPRMPKLVASCASGSGWNICWKLQVTFHDRHGNPHRDFDTGDPNDSNGGPYLLVDPYITTTTTTDTPDQITIPVPSFEPDPVADSDWHICTDGTPWEIFNDPDWQAAVQQGFFGGDAVLSMKIKDGNGNDIVPQQDFKFRIAGEKPDADKAKAYINSLSGAPWYAYAIAKEETNGEGSSGCYNHFLTRGGKYSDVKGKEGVPNWNNDGTNGSFDKDGKPTGRWTGTGGYGLFQLTRAASNPYGSSNRYSQGDADYIMPRSWIWNWQANAQGGVQEIRAKTQSAQGLYNGLTATYSASGAIPNYLHFSGLDAIAITYYNGMYGPNIKSIPVNGYSKPKRTCWFPVQGGWQFLSNQNDYVNKVNSMVE